MKLRNLRLTLYTGQWGFWIWMTDFEWLKLAWDCLQTVTVTNSEQQQLDKEILGCWLSCYYKFLRGDIFSGCSFHGTFSDTSAVSYSKFLDLKMVYVSSFITFMRHDFATSINIHIPFVLSQIRISGLCYGRFCRFILFGSKLLPYNHGLFLLISVNGQAGVHFLILHHFHCTCHSLVNSNYFMPTNV